MIDGGFAEGKLARAEASRPCSGTTNANQTLSRNQLVSQSVLYKSGGFCSRSLDRNAMLRYIYLASIHQSVLHIIFFWTISIILLLLDGQAQP